MPTPEKNKAKPKAKPAFKIKRVFKPEKCTSHKFIMEADGRVNTAASHEVTDDSICFNCGLYFSTWVWYSDKLTKSYRDGVDSEIGQIITLLAVETAEVKDKLASEWGEGLLELLRNRRQGLRGDGKH